MKRRFVLIGLGIGLSLVLVVAAKAPIPVPRPVQKSLRPVASAVTDAQSGDAIHARLGPTGRSGWLVVDLDTGEVLEHSGDDQGFAPASVAKIATTLYALDRLGPDHRFETRVIATGEQSGETLKGDLILEGGGDPELDTDALLPLVMETGKSGFRYVSGRFLVDGSLGPVRSAIDDDQPPEAAYNPAVSGLNLNFNRVRMKWTAKGTDREIRVSAKARRLDPDAERVRVVIADDAPAMVFRHHLEGEHEVWRVARTSLRRPGARWLPVRLPELYAGDIFRGLAKTYGVELRAPELADWKNSQPAAPRRVIARHDSRPLALILRDMLRWSTNLTAEIVGAAAGAGADHAVAFSQRLASNVTASSDAARVPAAVPAPAPRRPQTLAESAARMNLWAAGFAGFPEGDPEFRMVNHSGLATASRVSPRRMVALLQAAARLEPLPGHVHKRLPGQLAGLIKDYNIAARSVPLDYKNIAVAAKTGTMDFVRGLAGYVATPNGRRLAFAIFSNDLARRNEASRRTKRHWIARARVFERALLREWVRRFGVAG